MSERDHEGDAKAIRVAFGYDPETGVFTRLISSDVFKAGSVPGTINSQGYVRIRALGKLQNAHRLAWLPAKWAARESRRNDGTA